MQIPKLKVLVEAGVIREVAVRYAADAGDWTAQVTYATWNCERTEVLERQRVGARGLHRRWRHRTVPLRRDDRGSGRLAAGISVPGAGGGAADRIPRHRSRPAMSKSW